MGKPENEQDFVRLVADNDIDLYIAKDIWEGWVSSATELLVSFDDYGRFRLSF